MDLQVTEQRAVNLVEEENVLGIYSTSKIINLYKEFPWVEEHKRMLELHSIEPDIERSAPTLSVKNLANNRLFVVSVANHNGPPVFDIGFSKIVKRKKYYLFGPLVESYADWTSIEVEDLNIAIEKLKLFLNGNYDVFITN